MTKHTNSWLLSAGIFLIGILSISFIGVLLYIGNASHVLANEQSPQVLALKQVEIEVVTGHLWLEEVLSGDRSEKISSVYENFELADTYLNLLLNGGQFENKHFSAVKDLDVQHKIKEVLLVKDSLFNLTGLRYGQLEKAQAGTSIDKLYDIVFERFIQKSDKAEKALLALQEQNINKYNSTQKGLVISVVALVLCILVFFIWLERFKNKKHKELLNAIERLKDSEAQFRSLIEQSVDAMYLSDFDGNIIAVNKKACEFLGYERNELLNLKVADIDAKYPTKDDLKELWKNIKPEESISIETKHKCKNGKLIDVEVTFGLYEFSNKKLILGFARVITERKLAEVLLQQSEKTIRAKLDAILLPEGNIEVLLLEEILDIPAISEIMESIFKLTGVAVALGDLEGKILAAFGWQDICTQFHRVHPESFKNCNESDTLLSSEVEKGAFKLYKCKNNLWDLSVPIHVGNRHVGNIFVGQFFFEDETPELAIFNKQAKQYGFNENEYLLALQRVPRVSRETIEDLGAFYTQFSIMISDLSFSSIKFAKIVNMQKQAEDKIKLLNEELENKVIERTSELKKKSEDLIDSQNALLNIVEDLNEKSEQLQKNAAALEAVNQELESFSYSVSHDLRAPLRGIDGFSQALLEDYEDKIDEQGKDYLNRVRKGAQKMALLIDEMLNLSRLGRMAVKPTTVNLSQIAQLIIHDIRETDPLRNAEFIIAKDISCIADPILIRAVLENLLENAWKFTSKKSETKIEFGELDIEGKRTYFVKDNGAGFNMEYVNKLFTPFQRLHQESEFTGTGIGLTTVQRIISRHNGKIWAESEIDAGATFYFTLD